jgi:hypothetical protein
MFQFLDHIIHESASRDRKDGRAKRFERRYFLEAQGYDFGKVVERVAQLLDMPVDSSFSLAKFF